MKTLNEAIEYAKALEKVDQGSYAVVYSRGFVGQGPYFVVEVGQVPVLVAEGCKVVWEPEMVSQ
jgi:hypothetical protein